MKVFKRSNKNSVGDKIHKKYVRVRFSIYGQVVYVITILSVFLFVSLGIIFLSVNEAYMKSVIRQNGDNIGYLVEGAFYHSMLENNKGALQNTLDIINTLSGIDEVNMYDSHDSLVYSSFTSDSINHSNPNCIQCHASIASMFPDKGKSSRIISVKSECIMNHNDNSHRHLLIKSPIYNEKSCYISSCHAHSQSDVVLGSLVIKIPLENLDATLNKSSTDFFILASITTLVIFTFLMIFTRRKIQNPLNAIIKASEAVTSGDKSHRLEIKTNQLDDMRMVSMAFNDMLDNLQSANIELQNWSKQLEYKVQKKSEELSEVQNELINIERIASLGKLSLSVAHEINNPLSGILVYTKLVSKQLSNQELDPHKKESMLKNLMLIENETKRCGDIVKGLLDFSRQDQNDFEPKHLHEILHEMHDLMAHPMKISNISFFKSFEATSDLIQGSPNQIKQVCVALLVNASEAIHENGEIVMRTSNPDENHIRLEIIDNGIGINPEDISHIFEPFFSTKHNSKGIGLGLAIVHGIVLNHKGRVEARSEPGKGTTISIILPVIKT